MSFLSWAAHFEGGVDRAYFEVLIPRVMEEIATRHGTRLITIPSTPAVTLPRGTVESVAKAACDGSDAFHLIFIHADTGGRNLEAMIDDRSCAYCRAMEEQCSWPPVRCVVISPRHETEAWVLADPGAVAAALGFSGAPEKLGLPSSAREAERLPDPKQVLEAAARIVRRRSRRINPSMLQAAIAQRQAIDELRKAYSFQSFELALHRALADLGYVSQPS